MQDIYNQFVYENKKPDSYETNFKDQMYYHIDFDVFYN